MTFIAIADYTRRCVQRLVIISQNRSRRIVCMEPQDNAEQQLLTEGIPAYSDAMLAIHELEQKIQKRCERVLREKIREFESALGIKRAANRIKYYSFPTTISGSVEKGYTFLGVEIRLQSTGT